MCPAKSALRVQHELHTELICKHSHQPPALDGQNGPPPARLLCWIPFEAQSRSDLLWAAPRWTHVDSPWLLWVPAEVHPCLQIGPIEKTKIDLALKTVNIKSGFFKHKTAKTNDQIRDFGVVMKLLWRKNMNMQGCENKENTFARMESDCTMRFGLFPR